MRTSLHRSVILVVTNDEDWRTRISLLFNESTAQTIFAGNLERAAEIAQSRNVALLIFDPIEKQPIEYGALGELSSRLIVLSGIQQPDVVFKRTVLGTCISLKKPLDEAVLKLFIKQSLRSTAPCGSATTQSNPPHFGLPAFEHNPMATVGNIHTMY